MTAAEARQQDVLHTVDVTGSMNLPNAAQRHMTLLASCNTVLNLCLLHYDMQCQTQCVVPPRHSGCARTVPADLAGDVVGVVGIDRVREERIVLQHKT